MAFVKRRKQPHLFRDPTVDPTKQVRAQLEATAAVSAAPSVVEVDAHKRRKPARKRAKTVKH